MKRSEERYTNGSSEQGSSHQHSQTLKSQQSLSESPKKKRHRYPPENLNLTEEEVIVRYEALIARHLKDTTNHLPLSVTSRMMDDLRQEANIALLKCWRAYLSTPSSERHGNFITMSYKRIRGAIIDYYRDRRATTVHTADFVSWEEHDFARYFTTADDEMENEYSKDCHDVLSSAIKQLHLWERRFLHLYYNKETTLLRIGEMCGVTESRACQIHGDVLKRLRYFLEDETVGGFI